MADGTLNHIISVGQGGGSLLTRKDTLHSGNRSRFKIMSKSLAEEDAFDLGQLRKGIRSGTLFSVMNLAKGALGGGVLAGHVAYMTGGLYPSMCLNVIYGFFMCYSFYTLAMCGQRLCRRCHVASMTYPDIAEASCALFPNPKIARCSFCFRLYVDLITCLDLFGACAAYQLMVAKTIKQLVEGLPRSSIEGQNGMPNLRVYIAAMIIPFIVICLITQIKYLAPFSMVANGVVALCLATAVHYAIKNNPGFTGMVPAHNFEAVIKYTGMAVFSMSTAGVAIPVENNMKDPKKFPFVMFLGYVFIIGAVFTASFFGYAAFLDGCESPITMNFLLNGYGKTLKGLIAVMVYVTHSVNFYMPFNCVFYYLKPKFKPENQFKAELILRGLIVLAISLTAIIFPSVDSLMGFLGCFCLSNMAFICPYIIYVFVYYERPGTHRKRLILRSLVLTIFGVFILICGSLITGQDMINKITGSGPTTKATNSETTTAGTVPE